MKKKIVFFAVALFVLSGAGFLEAFELDKDKCKQQDCKEDGFCQPGRPESGWACTPLGQGPRDCNSYYNCTGPE